MPTEKHTYICLFDLPPYDKRVAPALRLYENRYDPGAAVALLREIIALLPAFEHEPEKLPLNREDYEHWIDSVGPDAGHKPSVQTLRELADMLIRPLCIPHGLGFNPMQEIDRFVPWLSDRSDWFADLEDGGEELAGGRLEFTYGSDSLIATKQQIRLFAEELRRIAPPEGDLASDYENLRRLLAAAQSNPAYTLLKTAVKKEEG